MKVRDQGHLFFTFTSMSESVVLALSKQACGRPPFSTLPRRIPFRRGFAFYTFFAGSDSILYSLRRRRVVAMPAISKNAATPGVGTVFLYPSMNDVTAEKSVGVVV